jgi:hypothetical protein
MVRCFLLFAEQGAAVRALRGLGARAGELGATVQFFPENTFHDGKYF